MLLESKSYGRKSLGGTLKIIVSMIEPGSSVLEMGCATGFVTKHLHENMNCKVTAVEIDPAQAEQARPYATNLVIGDISSDETWRQIQGPFDYVLFTDVLEHLVDPWDALRRCHAALTPNGLVLASIPNIAYWRIRLGLLRGNFDYTKYGIMDNSHLRFFTAKTVRDMFLTTGYKIDRFDRSYRKKRYKFAGMLLPNAMTYQFVIKASLDNNGQNSAA